MPNIPLNQIHLPESVAAAFKMQHRMEVEVAKVSWTNGTAMSLH
jgi:hypothetical protein